MSPPLSLLIRWLQVSDRSGMHGRTLSGERRWIFTVLIRHTRSLHEILDIAVALSSCRRCIANMVPPAENGTPASSPSAAKKQSGAAAQNDGVNGNGTKNTAAHSRQSSDGSNGATPHKQHTPATAEHLRYGHIDFEEVEEAEEDKRRHYLLRKPKVKQWFYRGKLFRSAEGRASARIEL